jgi:hypothetical protein
MTQNSRKNMGVGYFTGVTKNIIVDPDSSMSTSEGLSMNPLNLHNNDPRTANPCKNPAKFLPGRSS